jgi:hypothetical protein
VLVKPALGCGVGQGEMQPDEDSVLGYRNLEPGRETGRIKRDCGEPGSSW